MTNCVEFLGVDKSFRGGSSGGQKVLDGIRLEFPEGITTAVVGESGSGKTTLLQLINAVLEPDAGEVRVFGESIPDDHREKFRRGIGYSVQGAGLFPHLTNRDNVVLLAKLEGWGDETIEDRYGVLLAEMGLPRDVSDRYPRELSGGQQQRVGLCRALMLRPRLLLLDEPFSAVDPITRIGIYERFQSVQEHEGVSAVLVTHDMREAVRLAGNLVILREGKVLQHGPPKEVLNSPAHEYVEMLVKEHL